MAMMDPTGWDSQDHQALQQTHDDDFHQFLNMGGMANLGDGLQFDFQDFQGAREQMDTPMGGTETAMIMANSNGGMAGQMPPMTTAMSHPTIPSQMIPAPLQNKPTDPSIDQIDAQIQYLQQQKLQHQQRQLQEQTAFFSPQNHVIPPTPQSLDIQPAAAAFFSPDMAAHHQPPVFDSRYQRLKEQQDLSFTPLVSPAVTPLDPNFPVDAGYTVPGAYFSPLTSPALHAQTEPGAGYDQRANSASTNSPDVPNPDPASGAADLSKKVRKNNASKSSRKTSVRQSPIAKPQRRKTASNPALVTQVLSEMAETNVTGSKGQVRDTAMTVEEPEENGSVSPENLSDMPPPPIPQPRSTSRSPFIAPQSNNSTGGFGTGPSGKPSPATPATLMKLPVSSVAQSTSSGAPETVMTEPIENFELPESANFPKAKLSPLDTQSPVLSVMSPLETGSAKTPVFHPQSSPIFAKPTAAASASQSPQILPGSSSSAARKTPQLAPRGSKKRSSTSSVHVSPALRPKISPNIKPLLPGAGGVSAEDTASRLLASKSNYQNILEGNKVPGVSYPSELSTNLTSKRTSHKIAEQGRRNRINSALQEIATLLPRSVIHDSAAAAAASAAAAGPGPLSDDEDAGGRRDGAGKAAGAPNSKASTVEMAIEYIKQLKREVAEATKRAEEAEMKLEQRGAA